MRQTDHERMRGRGRFLKWEQKKEGYQSENNRCQGKKWSVTHKKRNVPSLPEEPHTPPQSLLSLQHFKSPSLPLLLSLPVTLFPFSLLLPPFLPTEVIIVSRAFFSDRTVVLDRHDQTGWPRLVDQPCTTAGWNKQSQSKDCSSTCYQCTGEIPPLWGLCKSKYFMYFNSKEDEGLHNITS